MANTFKVGDQVEIMDFDQTWKPATLLAFQQESGSTKIKYKGADGWDTEMTITGDLSSTIRPLGSSGSNTAQAASKPAPQAPAPAPAAPAQAAPPPAAPARGSMPASNAAQAQVGDTVYYLNINTGKWQPGKIDMVFDTAYAFSDGMVEKSAAISEAEAKRRGIHQTSTREDRARYIESLYAAYQPIAFGHPVVDAIVAEHNRIRRNPSAYAAELKQNRQALIDSRTKNVGNPDPVDIAARAIDTAIQDLEALEPLPPLVLVPAMVPLVKQAAERGGGHTSISEMSQNWKTTGGMGNGGPAESISGVPDTGSDTDKGKAVVQGLFIDWGSNNAGNYGHRANIIDKRLVSAPKGQISSYTNIAPGIAQSGTVYIQYYYDTKTASSR